ncbi:hypothetical protein [Nostoc sp.]|uniref:hypothetical protein n=1 Tax=Nostoc sp. TaxID=1180 RepID=UPI002FF59946
MIDDMNISNDIINNPDIQVGFNTNTQSTRLIMTGDWMFHYSGGRRQKADSAALANPRASVRQEAGRSHRQRNCVGFKQGRFVSRPTRLVPVSSF